MIVTCVVVTLASLRTEGAIDSPLNFCHYTGYVVVIQVASYKYVFNKLTCSEKISSNCCFALKEKTDHKTRQFTL